MAIDDERLAMIRANAALVVSEATQLRGEESGFDTGSVAWVDGFIERQRAGLTPDSLQGLVNVLGCYLGEAIVAAVPGAEWADDADGVLGILFPTSDMAFPFNKVAKQLAEGREAGESVLSFYNISVSYVAADRLGQATSEETP